MSVPFHVRRLHKGLFTNNMKANAVIVWVSMVFGFLSIILEILGEFNVFKEEVPALMKKIAFFMLF